MFFAKTPFGMVWQQQNLLKAWFRMAWFIRWSCLIIRNLHIWGHWAGGTTNRKGACIWVGLDRWNLFIGIIGQCRIGYYVYRYCSNFPTRDDPSRLKSRSAISGSKIYLLCEPDMKGNQRPAVSPKTYCDVGPDTVGPSHSRSGHRRFEPQ